MQIKTKLRYCGQKSPHYCFVCECDKRPYHKIHPLSNVLSIKSSLVNCGFPLYSRCLGLGHLVQSKPYVPFHYYLPVSHSPQPFLLSEK